MTAIGIVAFGAVSALGEGSAAVSAGDVGSRARVGIGADAELAHAGLARPFAGRVAVMGEDRGDVVLARALTACAAELDVRRPGWQGERVGLVLGTSSGGMRAAEGAFAAIEAGRVLADTEAPTYYGPVARAARRLGQ